MNNQNKNIDTNGGYKPEDAVWHAYSPKLCLAIMEFFQKEIVNDSSPNMNWRGF